MLQLCWRLSPGSLTNRIACTHTRRRIAVGRNREAIPTLSDLLEYMQKHNVCGHLRQNLRYSLLERLRPLDKRSKIYL